MKDGGVQQPLSEDTWMFTDLWKDSWLILNKIVKLTMTAAATPLTFTPIICSD